MAEEKTFRYGFIMLGFFLVMTGMFIMSVEKPHIYITFCALGVLLIAVGITWSMCQCYPKVTLIPVDPEAERFLNHKPTVLPDRDMGPCSTPGSSPSLQAPCPEQEDTSAYEKSLPSYEQIQRQAVGLALLPATAQPRPHGCGQPALQATAEVHRELGAAGDPPREPALRTEAAEGSGPPQLASGAAPLASLLEDMDTPSLEGSVPGSPVLQGQLPPSTTTSGCAPASSLVQGRHPISSRKGAGVEDNLYYGFQEGSDALLEDSESLFEPE
ncbi:BSND protein, partial [Rhinopomastus cyanomelas]|nr:BSND protein [Rhinopomastus cyanomelas]